LHNLYSIVSNSSQKLLAYADCGSFRAGILSRERLKVIQEAGSGAQGSQDGHILDARFPDVFCVTFMPPSGDLLIAEKHIIRRWNMRSRTVSHFAGVRHPVGEVDDFLEPKSRTDGDGPVLEATFNYINDITCDERGVVYVADAARIRRISGGRVETVAGGPEVMYRDGPSETSVFEGVICVALGKDGALYVCDAGCRIRKVFRGHVSTIDLTAPLHRLDLKLSNIFSISMNTSDGNLYISSGGSIYRATVEVPPPPNVWLGRNISTNAEVVVREISIPIHKEFLDFRCPLLLKDQSNLERVADAVTPLFFEFLYSGRIPQCEYLSLELAVRTPFVFLH
jgi:hypothetical protein